MNYQGDDELEQIGNSSADQPLINSSEASSHESIIEEEKTDSTGQSSSMFQTEDQVSQNLSSENGPPLLRRSTKIKKNKQQTSNWFSESLGVIGGAVADVATKAMKVVNATIEEEEKVVVKKEQTQDEKFVQDLYKRVHTQSKLLQNQMTLNIILEIKDRSRREDNPSPLAQQCGKWRKNIVPLKWISLFLLAVIPIFQIPNWCIRQGLNIPGVHSSQCDPINYPNSDLVKFQPETTTALTILAYILLSIFIIMRLFIKKKGRGAVCRAVTMLGFIAFSTIDLIWVLVSEDRASTAIVNIFNVMLLLFFVRAIREVWIQFMQVVIASVPVFVIIFAYLILFTVVGFILYANSEEDTAFRTLNMSAYTVFILFTVSNYPDVQIPYFKEDRLSMIYFWTFLLIGIFLLSNLLLAQIFLNYKKLISSKLRRYSDQVEKYFKALFESIDYDKKGYLTVEEFKQALGGEEIVEGDKRLTNLIWQSELILDGKIQFQDFAYVLEFTDTIEQQKVQIDRIKRFIKKRQKQKELQSHYQKAKDQIQLKYQEEKTAQKKLLGLDISNIIGPMTNIMQIDMDKKKEDDIEAMLQKEEDEELIKLIKKQNRPVFFCFKQKIKKDVQERVRGQLIKSQNFKSMLEDQNIDTERILQVNNNKVVDEYGRVYLAKEHHGKWRRRQISCQNSIWSDVPMTVLGILCLFFIPLFQYCHELIQEGERDGNQSDLQKARRLTKILIWINFLVAVFFGLEIAIKAYAFGLRRAYMQASMIIKAEFFYQPVLWILWFIFISDLQRSDFSFEINVISLGILLRSLRVSALLNEIEVWRNFIRTLRALFKPFMNFSVTLYSLYLIYACIGLEIFGGKINQEFMSRMQIEYPDDVPEGWIYLNFNDYIMSMNTLFGMMWLNDWEAIVYMYELVLNEKKDTAVLVYFVTFMELSNLIFVNIIIAFVIDTYQSIDETLAAEVEAKEMTAQSQDEDGAGKLNKKTTSLLQELNNDPAQFSRIMEILNSHMSEQNDKDCDEDDDPLNRRKSFMDKGGMKNSITSLHSRKSSNNHRHGYSIGSAQSIQDKQIVEEEDSFDKDSFGTDSGSDEGIKTDEEEEDQNEGQKAGAFGNLIKEQQSVQSQNSMNDFKRGSTSSFGGDQARKSSFISHQNTFGSKDYTESGTKLVKGIDKKKESEDDSFKSSDDSFSSEEGKKKKSEQDATLFSGENYDKVENQGFATEQYDVSGLGDQLFYQDAINSDATAQDTNTINYNVDFVADNAETQNAQVNMPETDDTVQNEQDQNDAQMYGFDVNQNHDNDEIM